MVSVGESQTFDLGLNSLHQYTWISSVGLAATKEFASEQDCLGFCACVQWFCQNQILALIPYVIKVDM